MDKKKKIVFIAAAVIAAVFFCLMDFTPLGLLGLNKENGNHGMFDTMLLYSADEMYSILSGTTARGFVLYQQVHIFDYIFLLSFGVCMMLFLDYLIGKNKLNKVKILFLFPAGEILCDLLENVFIDVAVSLYPTRVNALVALINVATMGKWYFLLGYIVVVVSIFAICKRKNKKPAPVTITADNESAENGGNE